MNHEASRCVLCGSDKFEPMYFTRDRHYGISGLYRIVRCTNCLLICLAPLLSDQELSVLYPEDYYAFQNHSRGWSCKEVVKVLLGLRIGTRDPRFDIPGRMLDLGCGTGWFLCDMRDQGWDVYGVEINRTAAEIGSREGKLEIFAGTLQEAAFPPNYFDYIRANHSFEHISSPNETLTEIYRILKPNGKLLLGVPNVSGLNAKIFGKYWWYLGAPVHPFSYSVRTLTQLLRKHAFDVVKINYNSDYSGILGSAQIWLNRSSDRKSTDGVLFNSTVLKIVCQWAAKCIDLFNLGDAVELIATKCGNSE